MKLDQIPKNKPFDAPQGYFDTLPGIVQRRIETEQPVSQPRIYFRFAFQYALPLLALIAIGIFWFRAENQGTVKFENELAGIDAYNLESFIEVDVNADELIETTNFTSEDVQELENTVYSSYDLSDTDVNGLLNIYEVEQVKDSVQ